MITLAFDTSGTAGDAAILAGNRCLAESRLDVSRRSAQTLAPAIRDLLQDAGIAPAEISLVATTVGPGSFTGLRIGVTTAKTFAYAVGADVIGLDTLEVLAAQAQAQASELPSQREVHAVLDAQRGEFFVGKFRLSQPPDSADLPNIERLDADRLMSVESWRAGLTGDILVTGSGLRKLKDGLPAGIQAADEGDWEPQAAILGRLALRHYEAGRRDDLWKIAPVYLRPSYAEEKAAARNSRGLHG